ncbi:putative hydrolase MutT/NUDIX [Rhodococcoides trifolii]|uniref:Hydrolase MutT/NUDIX n=1 Tax=Rhodococcoides trifolii TaxID=908250 RepID=A0A917D004_9NOCA|nr:NUDIX hydrolase [Rhodococcus trifolii]GGG06406.1 putative hydrolase MutT/NUDIX [Rhodococcus trifolii]
MTPSSHSKDTTVYAAGAVLWRHCGDGIEIALVHRPRYDDWTFPKGKVEKGEVPSAAAVREVAEETGFRAVLGRSLSAVTYRLPSSKKSKHSGDKHVDYWAAEAVDGSFARNDEVDELTWVHPEAVRDALSYDIDAEVFERFEHVPADTSTVILVRHARAGSKSRYRGDDRERPLDSLGVQQATALVPMLSAFGGTRIHCADRVRCIQTVEPWARATDTAITTDTLLTEEGYAANPDSARARALAIATSGHGVPVICSQGKVIPDLVQWWADKDGLKLERTRSRKASVWVLSLRGGSLVAADHIDSPLPRMA